MVDGELTQQISKTKQQQQLSPHVAVQILTSSNRQESSMEVVLHLHLLLVLMTVIFPWDISGFHYFSHFQTLFFLRSLKE